MVEIRIVAASEKPDPDADWALVERDGRGRYVGSGSKADPAGGKAYVYAPPAYDSKDEAVRAAQAWAVLAGVPVVYLRTDD